jgi:hypothetical protein
MSCGVAEVEQQVLDDEEVVCRSARMARESVVLQPHVGVSLPVISGDIGRSSEKRGEPHIPHVLPKGPRAPLVW